ncbi:MAG: RIO1 family regulatory kinase/ATPase [Infirmifilum sp.]
MSVKFSAWGLRELSPRDLRVLAVIERGMINHEYVDVELISSISRIDKELLESILKKLNKIGLVQRYRGSFTGYVLTSRGYDTLALHALVKRGIIVAVSETPIGEGKESEVYLGKMPGDRIVAVKVHRAGRTSFKGAKRVRGYVMDRRHLSWLYLSRLSARSEFEALRILWRSKVSVPEPIDWNRHIVVTGFVEGIELSMVPPLDNPAQVLQGIVAEVEKAYRAGVVHGDLNEFNVLLVDEDRVVLIDWPQWVSSSHPNALFYLKRDLENIMKFFWRKYRLSIDKKSLIEDFLRKL